MEADGMKTDKELMDVIAQLDDLMDLPKDEADRRRSEIFHELTPAEGDRVCELMRQRNRKWKAMVELLRPYWGPGMTMEQAVAAYQAAHPGKPPTQVPEAPPAGRGDPEPKKPRRGKGEKEP
jgi:hypothetical protein